MIGRPPRSTLLPSPTLSRSQEPQAARRNPLPGIREARKPDILPLISEEHNFKHASPIHLRRYLPLCTDTGIQIVRPPATYRSRPTPAPQQLSVAVQMPRSLLSTRFVKTTPSFF